MLAARTASQQNTMYFDGTIDCTGHRGDWPFSVWRSIDECIAAAVRRLTGCPEDEAAAW